MNELGGRARDAEKILEHVTKDEASGHQKSDMEAFRWRENGRESRVTKIASNQTKSVLLRFYATFLTCHKRNWIDGCL